MKRRRLWIVGGVFAALLLGCAVLAPRTPTAVPPPVATAEVAQRPATVALSTEEQPTSEPILPTVTPMPPTITPVPPTPTITPTPTTVPTLPPPVVMAGQGKQITADIEASGPLLIIEFTHDGGGYFGVQLKDAATAELVDVVANQIGAAQGSKAVPIEPGRYFYEVDADGNWSLTTKVAEQWTTAGALPQLFTGTGPMTSPIFTLAPGRANFAFTHAGEGYFGVMLFDVNSGQLAEVLVNQIGPANVTATAAAGDGGRHVLQVEADGAWTAQVSQ